MNYDLHLHSNYSDGLMSVETIFQKAKELNISVVITDHNEIRGSIELFEKSGFGLCGIEVGCKDGKEVLLYFNNAQNLEEFFIKEIEPFKTYRMTRIDREIEEILNSSKDHLFSIYPHPFGPYKKNFDFSKEKSKKILEFVDGIEIFNSLQSISTNEKAQKLSISYKKFAFSSSDAHILEDIGNGLTLIEFDQNGLLSSKVVKKASSKFQNKVKTLNSIALSNVICTTKRLVNV